jgi:hypothetical protein
MAKSKKTDGRPRAAPGGKSPKKTAPARTGTKASGAKSKSRKARPQTAKDSGSVTLPAGDLRMKAPRSGVTVRMYRTGLGDCFLLCFARRSKSPPGGTPARPGFVLIDCGVFKGTKRGPAWVKTIASHIHRATNDKPDGSGVSHLDLLVVTHEHWDHLSGFHDSQAQDVFKRFDVGAVWLPWTEDHTDPLALRLRKMKVTAGKALRLAYKEMIARSVHSEGHAMRVKSVLNMLGFGDDEGALLAKAPKGFDREDGAGEALLWIKDHFKDAVRFCEPGMDPEKEGLVPGLEGVRFYVLGPPKDEDLVRRLNPREKDDEAYSKTKAMAAAVDSAYFAAFGAMPGELTADGAIVPDDPKRVDEHRRKSRPFDESFRLEVGMAKAKKHKFFKSTYFERSEDWRRIDGEWLAAAGQFALNVDGLANNSSLVLAIELSPGGRVLLFPGDAQMGNWLSWFGKVPYPGGNDRGRDMVWTLKGGRKVDAKDLLARTVLYKVGHHGSHNATLKRGGLEVMGTRFPNGFVAMLPVRENLARNHTTYGEMPLTSIVYELLGRTEGRLLRTDEGDEEEKPPRNPRLVPTINGVLDRKPLPPDKMLPNRTDDPSGLKIYFDYTIFEDT